MGPPGLVGLEEVARDDHALHLRRALADLAELGVPVEALYRELARVAVSAVNLDRLGRAAHRDLGREDLRHRGLAHHRTALVLPVRRAQREEARGLDLGREV